MGEKSTDKSKLPVLVSDTKQNAKLNTSMVETTTRIKTVDKAALTIQRNWRRRLAVRRRAVNRIIAVIRGKQGHNRALRMRELNAFTGKATEGLRILLVALVYSVLIFITLLCIFINLIFGIKFTQEQQLKWVWATFLATFLDWVLYSTSKIVFEWLLPPYVTEVLFILCVVGVVVFGYFCGDIVDPERNPWTAGLEVLCDVLPV